MNHPCVQLTEANFDTVLKHNDCIVIQFMADWCEPCHAFAPIFSRVAEKFPEVLFASVNVAQEQNLANDFDIRSVPTVMILRYQAAVLIQPGVVSEQELIQFVQEANALSRHAVYTGESGEHNGS